MLGGDAREPEIISSDFECNSKVNGTNAKMARMCFNHLAGHSKSISFSGRTFQNKAWYGGGEDYQNDPTFLTTQNIKRKFQHNYSAFPFGFLLSEQPQVMVKYNCQKVSKIKPIWNISECQILKISSTIINGLII